MSTLGDLVASIHSSLHSYSGTQEQVTWLTTGCSDTDTVLQVASLDTVQRGIAEVEDELVYVNATDSTGLQLPPFGRGFRGSTAAAHAANAMVTFDPAFPRVEIKRAINQVIEGLFPTLYQIKTADVTSSPALVGYSLPADCEGVLEAKVNTGPYDYWLPLSRWSYDPTSPEANGKVLNVFEALDPAATVRVVYRAKFGTFTADTDTFASVGLSESYADLILYCVTARMVRFLDPARLQVTTAENLARSQVVAAGDAGKVANQLFALYQQRLAEERTRLLELTPPSIHFTR